MSDKRPEQVLAERFAARRCLPRRSLLEAGDVAARLWANLLEGTNESDESVFGFYGPLILEVLDRTLVSTFFAFTSDAREVAVLLEEAHSTIEMK